MMRFMLAVVTGTGIGAGGAYAVHAMNAAPPVERASYVDQAQYAPRRIVIGLDLSKSNPLVADLGLRRQGRRAHRAYRRWARLPL